MKKNIQLVLLFCVVAILGACGGTAGTVTNNNQTPVTPAVNPSTSNPNTTSGSLATVAAGNQTLVFVPNGSAVVVATLEAGAPPALTLPEELTKAAIISTPISFTVDSCSVDVTDLKLVCVGYDSSKVAIINIAVYVSNIIAGLTASASDLTEFEVDLGNSGSIASFSGGNCINCGVLTDAGDHRFIVSSQDGYRVLDYTGAILKSYLSDLSASPAMSLVTENFTYDAVNNRIISPEYDTANNFLWVIDLASDKVYRWTNRMVDVLVDAANGLTGFNSVFSFGFEADSAAYDSSTGVLALADESANGLLTVNLNVAVYDGATNTFTAPYTVNPMDDVGSRLPGIAAESSNHYLFMEEELGGDGVGVAALPTVAGSGDTLVTNYIWATIPSPQVTCAADFFWANAGDPHGLALYTSVISGRSKGLLINGTKDCAAIIDLKGLLDSAKTVGTNKADPSVDLVAAGIISFVAL